MKYNGPSAGRPVGGRATTSGDTFGAKFATTNNGVLYTAKGAAALLVPFGSVIARHFGGWRAAFMVAVAFNATAAVLAIFVIRPMRRIHIERSNARALLGQSNVSDGQQVGRVRFRSR